MNLKNIGQRKVVIAVVGLIVIIMLAMCATSNWRARRALKHRCGPGMDCECFANIINNRLDMPQVRAFNKFLKTVDKRPTANILEFVDENTAREMSAAVSVCNRVVAEQPKSQPKPQPAKQQPKPTKKGK